MKVPQFYVTELAIRVMRLPEKGSQFNQSYWSRKIWMFVNAAMQIWWVEGETWRVAAEN